MNDNEQTFNEYIQLAESVFHRLGACTSCDEDYTYDAMCPELSVATLLWNHFCDRYVRNQGCSDEHLSMHDLVEHYDRDPIYAYAYLKRFESILDKYHVENTYPIDNFAE